MFHVTPRVSKRQLANLRDEATRNNAASFASLLKISLVSDFEPTFEFLKEQKLLHKFREVNQFAALIQDLHRWVDAAPLKGKLRARFEQHLSYCEVMTEYFRATNESCRCLNIWRLTPSALVVNLLGYVEANAGRLSDSLIKGMPADQGPLNALQSASLHHGAMRGLTDSVNKLLSLRQFCRSEAESVEPVAVNDAIGLCLAANLVETGFDNYSFSGWSAKVRDKEVRYATRRDDFERASHWFEIRAESNDHTSLMRVGELESRLRKTPIEVSSLDFDAFLKNEGTILIENGRGLSEVLYREMRHEVERLLDPKLVLPLGKNKFEIEELLRAWSVIYLVAVIASIFLKARSSKHQECLSILSCKSLLQILSTELKVPAVRAEKIKDQFTNSQNHEGNIDLFFRPFIELCGSSLAFSGHHVLMSRFYRNIFMIAIQEGQNISERGKTPLSFLSKLLKKGGYKVERDIPILVNGSLITDIDIAFGSDNFFFIGQCKVMLEPDSAYERWKGRRRLSAAADQLDLSMKHIDDVRAEYIKRQPGVLGSDVEIIPFLLTNVLYYTGAQVRGYPIIDFRYLRTLFNGGVMGVTQDNQFRPTVKIIAGDYPDQNELAGLIRQPLHRRMASNPPLTTNAVEIEGFTFHLPALDLKSNETIGRTARSFARLIDR